LEQSFGLALLRSAATRQRIPRLNERAESPRGFAIKFRADQRRNIGEQIQQCAVYEGSRRVMGSGRAFPSLEPESRCAARARFRGFFFSISWRRVRFEGTDEAHRDGGDVVNRGLERAFICLGGLVKAADLPDELQRSGANLIGRDRWIEVEQRSDISAHGD
jgi:hypothetical protein